MQKYLYGKLGVNRYAKVFVRKARSEKVCKSICPES